ncbi:MAG: outer membrane protein transport protein [Myxococcota bacterium]|nr:outer membrane protein transport protein [Myxococcota bacterium]
MHRLALIVLPLMLASAVAEAGGMVLPVRGVRALARGGALVAGAADADALWQNPAGLAHAAGPDRRALLFDLGVVYQPVEHTRVDADGLPLGMVTNQQPSQPVPTLAASLGIGDRLVIAGGLATPYSALHRYPDDGPQRYASVSLGGSAFVTVTIGAAYQVTDQLRIGATLQDTFSQLSSRIVLAACPDSLTCAPEDRSFDMLATIEQTDYLAPSGSLGIQYDATPAVTLGLVLQGPTRISAGGTLEARLPSSSVFDGARIVGDDVRVSMTLPPSVRAGIELRLRPALRIEAALDVELWSVHDEITIEPQDIRIENAPGFGTATFRELAIPRDYRTSVAPSLGVEWHGPQVMVAAGYAYETAAAPPATVSVLTVDAAKHLIAIGGGYEADGWQIGGALGYVHVADVEVAPGEAAVTQLEPLRDTPSDTPVNAGTYQTRYVLAGLRFARRW